MEKFPLITLLGSNRKMTDEKYLRIIERCPNCNTRLFGNIKVVSLSDSLDLISFKKVSPVCHCTKCGQLFESRPHVRSTALLSLLISVVIMIPTIPLMFMIGSLIHTSLGYVLAVVAMCGSLFLPLLLLPGYKPKKSQPVN